MKEYAGDWQQYALIFFQEAQANFKTIIEGQKAAEINANQRYQSLFEEHMRLNETMRKMEQEIDHVKEEREY